MSGFSHFNKMLLSLANVSIPFYDSI